LRRPAHAVFCTAALKCAGMQPYVMDRSEYNLGNGGYMDLSEAGDC